MAPDQGGDKLSTTIFNTEGSKPQRHVFPGHTGEVQLEILGGPMDGARCRKSGSILALGRGQENDLVLHLDPHVSTTHARIVREGEHYWLEDLGSSNGTFLGDERIKERTLIGPGTRFVVGRTCLEFMPV